MKALTRRDFLKVMGVGAVGTSAALALAACGKSGGKTGGKSGKTKLTIAVTSFESLSPFNPTGGAVMITLLNGIYQSLVSFDEYAGSPKGDLCKSFEQDASDKTLWHCELYDYITDSKGNKITTADVAYSLDQAKQAGTRAATNVIGIDVKDDYKFDLQLSSAYPSAWSQSGFYVISKAQYEKDPKAYVTDPAGTGPYTVRKFTSGASLVLEKREGYWQKPELNLRVHDANIDVIQFDVIAEPSQIQLALQSGNIQFGKIDYEIADTLSKEGKLGVLENPESAVYGFAFNMYTGIFADNKKLREAVCYAIDKEAVLEAESHGHGDLCNTWGGKRFGGYSPKFDSEDYYSYNPDKAKECLKEAGYPDGVTVNCLSLAWPAFQIEAQVVQANLAAVGITLDIHEYDDSTYKSYKKSWDGLYDMMIINGPSGGFAIRSYREYLDQKQHENGYCLVGIKDDALQALYEDAAMNELDPDKFYAFASAVTEILPLFGIYTGVNYYGYYPKIKDVYLGTGDYPIPGGFILGDDWDIFD